VGLEKLEEGLDSGRKEVVGWPHTCSGVYSKVEHRDLLEEVYYLLVVEARCETVVQEVASTVVVQEQGHICLTGVHQPVEHYMVMPLEELLEVQGEKSPVQVRQLVGCMYSPLKMACLAVGTVEIRLLRASSYGVVPVLWVVEVVGWVLL